FNLQMTLEFSGYNVVTARNGLEALDVLSYIDNPPDLIISDILMPGMDGYELFQKISTHPLYFRIPFIFLTARTSPDDIRFGKMLGVDDYITKPFDDEDLLATIAGKIARRERSERTSKLIEKRLISLLDGKSSEFKEIILLMIQEDDNDELDLKLSLPSGAKPPFSVEKLGNQLYEELIRLNDEKENPEPQLLRINSIEIDVYTYFDSKESKESKNGSKKCMFAVIAPKISYFNSIK
ncbi:MAG: response regulator, partial [Candidatus Hodarchaeales archaeon]